MPRCRRTRRNPAIALDLARIADVDDHHVMAFRALMASAALSVRSRIGLVDQRFDPAVNGLALLISSSCRSFGACDSIEPESRSI